jgi:hypothetical protein
MGSIVLTAIVSLDGQVGLAFPTTSDRQYWIEATPSLSHPTEWTTLTNLTGSGSEFRFVDPETVNRKQRFYRVRAQ